MHEWEIYPFPRLKKDVLECMRRGDLGYTGGENNARCCMPEQVHCRTLWSSDGSYYRRRCVQ